MNSYAGIIRDPVNRFKGPTKMILMEILLNCNHSDNHNYMFDNKNLPLKRGQLITSIPRLCENTGFSRQTVRTVLKNLKKSEILTDQSTGILTGRARLLTIVNINNYLHTKHKLTDQLTDQLTGSQHTPNRPLTPIKNDKKEKKETPTVDFEDFWNLYGKKTSDKKKTFSRWKRLTKKEKEIIFETLPAYVKSTPVKQYRKNPLTYLNSSGWEHEIIGETEPETKKVTFYGGIDD